MSTFSKKMVLVSFELVSIMCAVCMCATLFAGYKCFEYKKSVNKLEEQVAELETKMSAQNDEINELNNKIENINDTIESLKENNVENEIELTCLEVEEEPVFFLSDYQRQVTECIVAGESMSEPYDGQVAVAECILNACLKDGLQPSEVRTKYKYSGWNDEPSESVKKAVSAVFDDGYKITDEFILYFYAPKYTTSKWHESQDFVMEIGGHRFFTEWDN